MYLDELRGEVSQGDIFDNLPFASVEEWREQVPVRSARALLLTYDCEYDKPTSFFVLIAEVLPLSGVASGSQGNLRKNRIAGAFYLPAQADFPESYVDFRTLNRVAKAIVVGEARHDGRLLSLIEAARLAMQEQLAAFFGYGR
jgi:hypothetical protein